MHGYYALSIYPNILIFMKIEIIYFVKTDSYKIVVTGFNGEKIEADFFLSCILAYFIFM